jgi:hypothetical protein
MQSSIFQLNYDAPFCEVDEATLLPGKIIRIKVREEEKAKIIDLSSAMAVHRFKAPVDGANMSFAAFFKSISSNTPFVELEIFGEIKRIL